MGTGRSTGALRADAEHPTSPSRRAWRVVCWWLGLGCLGAALATSVATIAPPAGHEESLGFATPVVGSWVPATGAVFLIALALAIGLLVAARVLAPAPQRPLARTVIRTTVLTVLFLAAAPAGAIVALTGSDYRMLPGVSEGGCRIVVQEYTFLFAAWGHAGIVQPGATTVDWAHGVVDGYTADDGYKPFTAGTYRLEWDGRSARLAGWGSSEGPARWSSGEQPDLVCDR
jgi:hypothetical protein